ncbi:hypothetical protein [Celeribacter indicus]|nr:hypothetical protein [Celeribacter indicus]SDX23215.1 hypothetical protein SAMN05443573_11827 [Celeribacter indicus]
MARHFWKDRPVRNVLAKASRRRPARAGHVGAASALAYELSYHMNRRVSL